MAQFWQDHKKEPPRSNKVELCKDTVNNEIWQITKEEIWHIAISLVSH